MAKLQTITVKIDEVSQQRLLTLIRNYIWSIRQFDRRKGTAGASLGVRQQHHSERREGPKDAVEGTTVVAGDQTRASYPIRSRAAHFLRRTGIGAPLLSTHRVEGADSTSVG